MRRPLSLAALIGIVGACGAALAQDQATVTVTNTTTAEFRIDNKNGRAEDDNFGLLLNRLNLSGTSGQIATQLRLDTVYFPDETLFFPNPPRPTFRDDARLERLTVRYSLGDWTLTAGDFYRQVGRGIALSIRKVDEAGLDVTLRGGDLQWESDDHRLGVFAGLTNPVNIDTISQSFIEDTDDIVVGSDWEYLGLDIVNVGLYAVFVHPSERLLPGQRDFTFSEGITLSSPGLTDWLSIYAELGAQRTQLAGAVTTGRGVGDTILANAFAAYMAVDMNFSEIGPGDVILLLEALALDDYEVKGSRNSSLGSRFDYNFAPTLERIDQEVFDNTDVRGARARLEYAIPDPELVFFANSMVRINHLDEPGQVEMFHNYGGFDLGWQEGISRVVISAGARREVSDEVTFKAINHVEVDLTQHIGAGFSLHIASNVEDRLLDETKFLRGSTFLGGDIQDLGGLTFEFGYDTQDPSPEVRNLFFAGILALDLGALIGDEVVEGVDLRATVGTQRGGIKCISGVCREFPAFAGGRLEIVGRF